MNPRKVVFSNVAREPLRVAKAWWIENQRPAEILVDEIEQAVRLLA